MLSLVGVCPPQTLWELGICFFEEGSWNQRLGLVWNATCCTALWLECDLITQMVWSEPWGLNSGLMVGGLLWELNWVLCYCVLCIFIKTSKISQVFLYSVGDCVHICAQSALEFWYKGLHKCVKQITNLPHMVVARVNELWVVKSIHRLFCDLLLSLGFVK